MIRKKHVAAQSSGTNEQMTTEVSLKKKKQDWVSGCSKLIVICDTANEQRTTEVLF